MTGILYLCGTPIGNLEDITIRVLNILKTVDCIAAEDTRHTVKLLNHFEITTPMVSYHEHNKQTKGAFLIEKLKEGATIALVTDAGMPGISDPGEDLVRRCYENDITVTAIPGACAAILALILSGLSTRRFVFEGFLPSDKKEKREVLKQIEKEHRTMVFYEAPHRLMETLQELYDVLGERKAVCSRELTKKYEEVRRDTIGGLLCHYRQTPPKGEFVIVIEGVSLQELKKEEQKKWREITIEEHMKQYMTQGMSQKDAMKQVAKDRGMAKRELYAYLHKENEENGEE